MCRFFKIVLFGFMSIGLSVAHANEKSDSKHLESFFILFKDCSAFGQYENEGPFGKQDSEGDFGYAECRPLDDDYNYTCKHSMFDGDDKDKPAVELDLKYYELETPSDHGRVFKLTNMVGYLQWLPNERAILSLIFISNDIAATMTCIGYGKYDKELQSIKDSK